LVFHGTDTAQLAAYQPFAHSILGGFRVQLSLCQPATDFGQGFYVTTWEHQARQWANNRARKTLLTAAARAVVLSFSISRDRLAELESLVFVRPTDDYWDLISDCRLGFPAHQRTHPRRNPAYDVVYGPVSLWEQRLVIYNADQISFHTDDAVAALPPPYVYDVAQTPTGLFP
jgi:hypothetical protein